MAEYPDTAPSVEPEAPKEKDKKPTGRIRKYWREIGAYDKAAQDWHEQSEKIVKLYLDQHRTAASARRFALLWSNIETLKPATYAKVPNVLCSRRHKDPHPVGRVAAEILERATNTSFDLYKADERFRMVRDDRLLTARGQGWVRYEADIQKDDEGRPTKINYEKVCIDYVHWRDFGHNVAGTWADVWLIWRKVYKSRAEVRKRFGKVADKLNYSAKTAADDDKELGEHKACLYELWDKTLNKVCFISKDYPEIIEDGEPPTNFRDFFPCPEPCYGTKTTKSLFPTPDYRYYQDQAQEIDDLTDKIANQCDHLAVKGFIPAGPSGDGADALRLFIQSLQSDLTNNKTVLIPVESWAAWSEKGGSKGLVDWVPIKDHAEALAKSIETRNQLIQDVYQITGIADILRGQTDPDETLGAQQLKAQTGARRVRNTKDELARFCRDIGQLVAEVIAEQFQPQTLAEMSGFAYVPAAQIQQQQMPGVDSPSGKTFDDQVVELLRNDRMRGFLIDIETDSTIQPDEDAEKQRRVEFVTGVGQFLKEALPAAQVAPPIIPMLKETLMFLARGFRAGRNVEDVFEHSMEQLQQMAQQAQGQPSPEVQQAQAEMQMKAQEMQMKLQLEQEKMQLEREKAQLDLQIKQQELQIKIAESQADMQLKAQEMQMKMEMEAKAAALDAQIKEKQAAIDAEIAQQQGAQQIQIKQTEAQAGMEMKAAEFGQRQEMSRLQYQDEKAMKAQDFAQEQQRKAKAFDADEKRKDAAAKAKTETETGLMKQRSDDEAKKPAKPKRVLIRKRDNDGRASELEIN